MPPPEHLPDGKPPRRIDQASDFEGRRILVVNPQQALPRALAGIEGVSVTIVGFDDLDAELLQHLAPDIVLAPLFAPDHDILDLARHLDHLGYQGALRAYAPPLPNSALVRTEVRQIWGARDFDILEIAPLRH